MKKAALILTSALFLQATLPAHSHKVVVEEVYCPPTAVIVESTPVVVNEAPPAIIVEEKTPCPGANYVCVDGHWEWRGKWVWKKHEWVLKPQVAAVWVPGHWRLSHHHQGYIWDEGHWK